MAVSASNPGKKGKVIMKRSLKLTVGVAVAAITTGVLTAALIATKSTKDYSSGIEVARAFDVDDKRQLMAYADQVLVGTVIARDSVNEEDGYTVWRVAVQGHVKGTVAGEVRVRQLGYVESNGNVLEQEDQTLLVVGQRYLMALGGPDAIGAYPLIVGGAASKRLPDTASERAAVAEYRAALR